MDRSDISPLPGQNVGAPVDRVDEALAAVESSAATADIDPLTREELTAMKTELTRMRQSIEDVSWASGRLARQSAASLREDVERRIRLRPVASVAMAAFAGYLFGITR